MANIKMLYWYISAQSKSANCVDQCISTISSSWNISHINSSNKEKALFCNAAAFAAIKSDGCVASPLVQDDLLLGNN